MITNKIKTREELAKLCVLWKAQGKKIGFTSGSFDLMHAGHALYLEKAREQCDVLLVGVNSNESVKKYKGQDRPIVSEKDRIRLIAALDSVDFCFLFEERRNAANIEELRPDFYIKAADYTEKTLTSKEIVEKYGGKVILIPLEEGLSTSNLIEKIVGVFGTRDSSDVTTVSLNQTSTKVSQAVFLDRDGTINENVGYLHEPEKFKLLPNVIEGLKEFQNMGLKLVIVTDQAGIGLGYFSKEDFFKVNAEMLKQFSAAGITVDKIYFCPHSRTEECSCKKPNTGLLERAKEELNLDVGRSYFVGDATKDIEAGRRVGCATILVNTGHKGEDGQHSVTPDYVANDLLGAALWVKEKQRV